MWKRGARVQCEAKAAGTLNSLCKEALDAEHDTNVRCNAKGHHCSCSYIPNLSKFAGDASDAQLHRILTWTSLITQPWRGPPFRFQRRHDLFKRQLGTRYDSTSHSTTMPSLCHHYATMPFPPGPWTSMDSMPLRLLCRAHRTLGIVRPFWFLAPWWRCVDLAGWSSFVQPHLEKKLHNVAFHVNKVQHGPAKKN